MNSIKPKLIIITFLVFIAYLFIFNNQNSNYVFEKNLHLENLSKSPFTKTKNLSKQERKKLELPPNAYNDELWELTMDPVLGRPRTENLFQIQEEQELLRSIRKEGVPGESPEMAWVQKGPNNFSFAMLNSAMLRKLILTDKIVDHPMCQMYTNCGMR